MTIDVLLHHKFTLQHTGGKRSVAAQLLGIGRNTLTRKIQELKLDVAETGGS